MEHTNKSMGGSSTKDDLSCGDMVQEVSEQDNINMRPRIVSCDILVKNVTAFCPSLKNMPAAKLKSYGLTTFAEEISSLLSTDVFLGY